MRGRASVAADEEATRGLVVGPPKDDQTSRPTATAAGAALGRWRSRGVWLVVVADLAWVILSLILIPEQPTLSPLVMAIAILMVASFGLVGALVVTRRPRNPVGWILWVTATVVTVSTAGLDYALYSLTAFDGSLPGTLALAWLSAIGFLPALATVLVFVPLLFPDGRLLSPRWRWVAGFGIVAIVVGPASAAFQPGLFSDFNSLLGTTIPNPLGIAALESLKDVLDIANLLGILIVFPVAIASSIIRYRRGSLIEREQLKWFAAAASLTVICLVPAVPGMPFGAIADIAWLLGIVAFSLIPVAIGIAILRYRLYDIDRIINRAFVYVPMTAIVAGIYTASIALSQRVLAATGQNSDMAIVLTTLVVVVVFTPIKNAVQATVDRRFKEAPTAHESPGAGNDPTELLLKLAELREKGILTDDEFAAKKGDILARL